MLCEISQAEKGKYSMVPLVCGNFRKSQFHRDNIDWELPWVEGRV